LAAADLKCFEFSYLYNSKQLPLQKKPSRLTDPIAVAAGKPVQSAERRVAAQNCKPEIEPLDPSDST